MSLMLVLLSFSQNVVPEGCFTVLDLFWWGTGMLDATPVQ